MTCRLLHVIVSGSIEVKGVPIEAIENPEENREEDQEESIESLKQKFGLMQFLLEIGIRQPTQCNTTIDAILFPKTPYNPLCMD